MAPSGPALPLVTVLTPVFNMAASLRACIESVLAQTWPRLEYVVMDNRSTDTSRAIAEEYAARIPWMRVVSAPRHVPIAGSFNHAFGQVSAASAYTKVVAADDRLHPDCVERLVGVAERRASIALVSSLTLWGSQVYGRGLPPGEQVFAGRDIGRRQLLGHDFFFGTPTTVLYRSALVRAHVPFFDPEALHPDTERAYRLMRDHDFGFVHEVLSFLGAEADSTSGRVADLHPETLDRLIVLLKYGRDFLAPGEHARALREQERLYCRVYLREAMGARRARFLAYHRPALAALGYRFPRSVLLRSASAELARLVPHLEDAAGRLLARVRAGRLRR